LVRVGQYFISDGARPVEWDSLKCSGGERSPCRLTEALFVPSLQDGDNLLWIVDDFPDCSFFGIHVIHWNEDSLKPGGMTPFHEVSDLLANGAEVFGLKNHCSDVGGLLFAAAAFKIHSAKQKFLTLLGCFLP
jgi:hypothetical protein